MLSNPNSELNEVKKPKKQQKNNNNKKTTTKCALCTTIKLFLELHYSCTSQLDHKTVSGPFLVPTVDGTDSEGVACPQDQSGAAVIFTGTLSIRMLANILLSLNFISHLSLVPRPFSRLMKKAGPRYEANPTYAWPAGLAHEIIHIIMSCCFVCFTMGLPSQF